MPRKKKTDILSEKEPVKKTKKNIMNTMIKDIEQDEQHIILQLPLNEDNINNIINNNNENINNNKLEPIPYEDNCYYNIDNKIIINDKYNELNNDINIDLLNYENKKKTNCYWCIHPIEYNVYSMPISYNNISNTYKCCFSFCSLQCANAYNFSINSGSDKVWEINSLIQMLGKLYNMNLPIRPAPSRYLLDIFSGGKLSIEEYRKLHLTTETSHLLNLPPMINISSSYEVVNTSYIKTLSENMKNSAITLQFNQDIDKDVIKKENIEETKKNILEKFKIM